MQNTRKKAKRDNDLPKEEQQEWEDVSFEDQDSDQFEQEIQYSKKPITLQENLDYAQQIKNSKLIFQNSAYQMLHRLSVQWPILSFDFILDNNPDKPKIQTQPMNKYPYQIFIVSGSQSTKTNYLYLMKLSKLHKTIHDDDSVSMSDSQDDDSRNEDSQITYQTLEIKHVINRVRTLNYSTIVAFWQDNGDFIITNLQKKFQKFNSVSNTNKEKVPMQTFKNKTEGYALDWNIIRLGELASGNNKGHIYIHHTENLDYWQRSPNYYSFHNGSVQDLKFSPTQAYVLCSCSSDGTIQIIDTRVGNYNKAQLKIKAHQSDVNVIDWNQKACHLIVSGGDDGIVKLWDLRIFGSSKQKQIDEQIISFNYHQGPISSIAFQPNDESVIAVASEDNKLSLWDLSVENQQATQQEPNQLMFLHEGQQQIKQIRFHPIYNEMVVSTGKNGIHLFKANLSGVPQEQEKEEIKQIEQKEFLKHMSELGID